MTVVTSHRTSTPQSSTGLTRRSALRGLGGVTVAALLAAGPQADRVMAQLLLPAHGSILLRMGRWLGRPNPAGVADFYAANVVGDDFATGEHFEGADEIRAHIEYSTPIFPIWIHGDLRVSLRGSRGAGIPRQWNLHRAARGTARLSAIALRRCSSWRTGRSCAMHTTGTSMPS